MASTETVRVLSVSQPSISLRWVEKYFYLGMSLLIAAVVVYGFSQTVEHKLIHANPRRPILLWVHAVLSLQLGRFLHHAVGAGTNPQRETPPNYRLGGRGTGHLYWRLSGSGWRW